MTLTLAFGPFSLVESFYGLCVLFRLEPVVSTLTIREVVLPVAFVLLVNRKPGHGALSFLLVFLPLSLVLIS